MQHRLRTFAAGLALAVPLVFAPGTASADPYTAHFEALRLAMQDRFDRLTPDSPIEQARERRALGAALAAITRPSTSFASDLRLLSSIAARIEKPTAEQAEIRAALAATADALETDLEGRRDAFALRVGDILSPALRARLDRVLERVTSDLDGTLPEDPVALRARVLVRAEKRMAASERFLARADACRGKPNALGRGYVASRVAGTVVEARRGGALVLSDGAGGVASVIVYGYESSDGAPTFRLEWATGAFTGTGAYEVTGTSGVFVAADSGGGPVDAVQCQILVTEFDATTRTLAGRFDGRLADGTLVSGGRFRVCGFAEAPELQLR